MPNPTPPDVAARIAAGVDQLDAWFPRNTTPADAEPHEPRALAWGENARRARDQGEALLPVAKSKKRKRSDRVRQMGRVGEAWALYHLPRMTGGTFAKAPTVQRSGYYVSTDTDLVGSLPLSNSPGYRTHIEVKAGCGDMFQLSRISDKERKMLNAARAAREGALLCFVRFPTLDRPVKRADVLAAYLVAWARWVEIERELAYRSETVPYWRGRSFRWGDDVDLLDGCELVRAGRGWALGTSHWLRPLLGEPGEAAF